MREGGLRKCEAAVVRGENPGFEVSKGFQWIEFSVGSYEQRLGYDMI